MLNIGFGEMLVIAALALVFIGPDELPKVMRTLGTYYGKVRRMSDELRRAFTLEVDRADAEARAEEIRRRREEMLAKRKLTQGADTAPRPEPEERAAEPVRGAEPAPATAEPAPVAEAPAAAPFPREGGVPDAEGEGR